MSTQLTDLVDFGGLFVKDLCGGLTADMLVELVDAPLKIPGRVGTAQQNVVEVGLAQSARVVIRSRTSKNDMFLGVTHTTMRSHLCVFRSCPMWKLNAWKLIDCTELLQIADRTCWREKAS